VKRAEIRREKRKRKGRKSKWGKYVLPSYGHLSGSGFPLVLSALCICLSVYLSAKRSESSRIESCFVISFHNIPHFLAMRATGERVCVWRRVKLLCCVLSEMFTVGMRGLGGWLSLGWWLT